MALIKRLFRRTRPARRVQFPSRFREDLSDNPDFARRRGFFAKHILIHTHVPKTAGSTISTGLQGIVGAVHSTDLRWRRMTPLQDLSPEDLDDLHFVSGHFPYGLHEKFDRIPLYFAAVRDPVDRAISGYRFLNESPGHPKHETVKGLSFEEAYDAQMETNGPKNRNRQAQILLGIDPTDRIAEDSLWERVDEAYFLITPQRGVTEMLRALRDAFGVPWAKPTNMNVSKGFETRPSPELRKRILEDNAIDAALVARVAETFEDRLRRACGYIAERCLKPLADDRARR